MTAPARAWRRALVIDLASFNVAIFFLAFLPPETLILPEWLAMIGSLLCVVGLVAHGSAKVHIPGEQWSYLATAWLATLTLVGYVTTAQATSTYLVSVPLFLISGVASAGAAHIIDGGVPRGGRGDE